MLDSTLEYSLDLYQATIFENRTGNLNAKWQMQGRGTRRPAMPMPSAKSPTAHATALRLRLLAQHPKNIDIEREEAEPWAERTRAPGVLSF